MSHKLDSMIAAEVFGRRDADEDAPPYSSDLTMAVMLARTTGVRWFGTLPIDPEKIAQFALVQHRINEANRTRAPEPPDPRCPTRPIWEAQHDGFPDVYG